MKERTFGPAGALVVLLVIFSLAYVVWGGREAAEETGGALPSDPVMLDYHNWLYLVKGARQRLHADFLKKKGREALAVKAYEKAALALGEVLEGLEVRYGFSLADIPGKTLKNEVRRQVGGVLLAQARCYRDVQDQHDEAVRALRKAVEIDPGPEVAGQAMFLLGSAFEEQCDLEQALGFYREAQRQGNVDIFETMFDLLEGSWAKRRFHFLLMNLMGSYRPVEAQARLIELLRRMGRAEEAEKETGVLIERYPFSKEAKEARQERGQTRSPIESILEAEDAEDREETFRVIPLEE